MNSQADTVHEQRCCPVCGCDDSHTIFSQRFDQLSEASLLDSYEIVICERCGAGFADHIPPQNVFDNYYRELSKYEYEYSGGMPPPEDQERSNQIAATVADYIPTPESRILEVGCANGVLLAALKERGFRNVFGVDPSPGCARVAKERFGIPVQAHSIFDIPNQEPFDFLILVGVMEHIRDLDRAVEKIRNLLVPNGCVYLAVPDAACFPGEKDAPYQEFSVEHINFFSMTSLTNLMQLRGFCSVGRGRIWFEPSHATQCVALYGVFEKSATETNTAVRDRETEPGLIEYIRRCRSTDDSIRRLLAKIADSLEPVLVWGTGAHTLRLLAAGALEKINVIGFVDSNPKYQGQLLHGRRVFAPADLISRTEPILISSYAAQKSIAQQIKDQLRLPNRVITLYEM